MKNLPKGEINFFGRFSLKDKFFESYVMCILWFPDVEFRGAWFCSQPEAAPTGIFGNAKVSEWVHMLWKSV